MDSSIITICCVFGDFRVFYVHGSCVEYSSIVFCSVICDYDLGDVCFPMVYELGF